MVVRNACVGLALTGLWLAAAQASAAADKSAFPIESFDLSGARIAPYVSITDFEDATLDNLDGVVITPASDTPEEAEDPLRSSFGDHYFRRILTPELGPYSFKTFRHQAGSIPLEVALVAGLPLYHGLDHWNWGKSDFHFHSEGWFGKDTTYLGNDKLGHAWGTYMYSDFFTQRIAQKTNDRVGAAVTGSLLGMAIQTGVEIGDGFSPDYGFSYEDLIADGVGAGFSLLRNTVPGLSDKLDFRMEYIKSEFSPFDPTTDYDGQKFILALKLSGFESLHESPLRFFELQAGYFARGVGDETVGHGVKRRREPYFAVGLNVQELLKESPVGNSAPGLFAQRALEYVQVPYTYLPTKQD